MNKILLPATTKAIEKNDAKNAYETVIAEQKAILAIKLNEKINVINDEIYDGKKKPPVLVFTETNYSYQTLEDTGTGTSFKNMIIYDDEYMEIAEFIRTIMNVHPKVEKAKGKIKK